MSPALRSLLALVLLAPGCAPQRAATEPPSVHLSPVGVGWARSSVNAVIFRGSSVVTHGATQYTAYYDPDGHVVLARRRLGSDAWEVRRTDFTGNVRDAHNAISLGVDGSGVLHMAWDLHGDTLRYARADAPGSLELTARTGMTGQRENRVTYPQFYSLPDGDLLFLYRDGGSGRGDVLLNRWDVRRRAWRPVNHPLVAGQGQRNAYPNHLAIDARGGWHLSWVWRETPDVATNHDVLYAYSPDQGRTWTTSRGRPYTLPITAANAEVARAVSQGSDLINQTSMVADSRGRPVIATYWRSEGTDIPQYKVVWHDGSGWRTSQVGQRSTPFRLSGGGTRRIPISRPLLLAGRCDELLLVFRDEERGGGVSVAVSTDTARAHWRVVELHPAPVGLWEPSHDPVVWQRDGRLHLFLQAVGQGQGETLEEVAPQPVSILEWAPRIDGVRLFDC